MRSGARAFEDWEDELILAAKPRTLSAVAADLGRNSSSVHNRRKYLNQWDDHHSTKPTKRAAPKVAVPIARPAWFDAGADRMDKARLMAGR